MKSIFEMLKICAVEDDLIINSAMQRFSLWEVDGADCYFSETDFKTAESFFMREAREGTTVEFFAEVCERDDVVEERFISEINPVIRQRLGFLRENGIKKCRSFFAVSKDLPKKELPKDELDVA